MVGGKYKIRNRVLKRFSTTFLFINFLLFKVTAQVYNGGMEHTVVTKVHQHGVLMQVLSVMQHINVRITILCRVHLVQVLCQHFQHANALQLNIG